MLSVAVEMAHFMKQAVIYKTYICTFSSNYHSLYIKFTLQSGVNKSLIAQMHD